MPARLRPLPCRREKGLRQSRSSEMDQTSRSGAAPVTCSASRVCTSDPRIRVRSTGQRSPIARIFSRSEEHTSELQSLMRISYAVFCLKKKNSTSSIVNYYYQAYPKDII